MTVPLSEETDKRLVILFAPERREAARKMLRKCGYKGWEPSDRVLFGALKLSQGDMKKLKTAVDLANADWRDLLMASGFGHDPEAHLSWTPEPPKK